MEDNLVTDWWRIRVAQSTAISLFYWTMKRLIRNIARAVLQSWMSRKEVFKYRGGAAFRHWPPKTLYLPIVHRHKTTETWSHFASIIGHRAIDKCPQFPTSNTIVQLHTQLPKILQQRHQNPVHPVTSMTQNLRTYPPPPLNIK